MKALREYCSKCWLILRARRREYHVVNNGADVRNVRILICEPNGRRDRIHHALYETIHRVTLKNILYRALDIYVHMPARKCI